MLGQSHWYGMRFVQRLHYAATQHSVGPHHGPGCAVRACGKGGLQGAGCQDQGITDQILRRERRCQEQGAGALGGLRSKGLCAKTGPRLGEGLQRAPSAWGLTMRRGKGRQNGAGDPAVLRGLGKAAPRRC